MYELERDGAVKTYLRIAEEGVSLVYQRHKAHSLPPAEYVYLPSSSATSAASLGPKSAGGE